MFIASSVPALVSIVAGSCAACHGEPLESWFRGQCPSISDALDWHDQGHAFSNDQNALIAAVGVLHGAFVAVQGQEWKVLTIKRVGQVEHPGEARSCDDRLPSYAFSG